MAAVSGLLEGFSYHGFLKGVSMSGRNKQIYDNMITVETHIETPDIDINVKSGKRMMCVP